ncbi:hypothetical protein BLNAU_7011 [Blattamonas nauphoetae]|uniref:Uncharacterized protein n=1 Tax=Blattamonas nauphoetae TaxID=2049346 RepID=A0ABQ9Y2Z8_9EUKA|nr:hypothetical protein BLNAU_7011 [Blattamonas nauphoetae]
MSDYQRTFQENHTIFFADKNIVTVYNLRISTRHGSMIFSLFLRLFLVSGQPLPIFPSKDSTQFPIPENATDSILDYDSPSMSELPTTRPFSVPQTDPSSPPKPNYRVSPHFYAHPPLTDEPRTLTSKGHFTSRLASPPFDPSQSFANRGQQTQNTPLFTPLCGGFQQYPMDYQQFSPFPSFYQPNFQCQNPFQMNQFCFPFWQNDPFQQFQMNFPTMCDPLEDDDYEEDQCHPILMEEVCTPTLNGMHRERCWESDRGCCRQEEECSNHELIGKTDDQKGTVRTYSCCRSFSSHS